MNHQLAIVIPAFKADFFEATLMSIAAQTDKRFVLYIGDDASPDDLASIIARYELEMTIVYQRFEQNLGKQDLVAHWERCIALTNDEEWIWLFSDDDTMDAGCVAAFYGFIACKEASEANLIHFDVEVVNGSNQQVWPFRGFPVRLEGAVFFVGRVRGELHSTVVEFIFRRSKWQQEGRFERFDLAWFTDDATWIKLSRQSGIHTISGPRVYWRYSGQNISSQHASRDVVRRKIQSGLDFMMWAKDYFKQHGLVDGTSLLEKTIYLLSVPLSSTALTWKEKVHYAGFMSRQMGVSAWGRTRIMVYVYIFGLRHLARKCLVGSSSN